ncbi:hypothetical protein mru_1754 [Methanobrevibacter ruminantium M1]|uniref:Uncharacterized protein n=1 Tax=Methanobrevibacter ruminantium (strain ATCC 35063 / DSM 1093 / JCM 13430 / OCM 146 / M1) TaxID=634498 RepID=D3DZ54_METRM|nr:hypothetical protein [Methanobrevibacter ruminantium]ADC47604.1 hypothetical protein mru_1754 [Methanobrevibacter ruminantium M1]
MINEIVNGYKNQQKVYLSSIIKTLNLDIPDVLSVYPKSNHDLDKIFKEIKLIDKDENILEPLEEFYIDTLKRGILSSIPLGKSFMVKLHRDDEEHFNEVLRMNSGLFLNYVPKISSLEDLEKCTPKYGERDYYKMKEEEQVIVIVEGILRSFCEFTTDNNLMVDYHFEELFDVLDIDLKLAKKRCNKRIKLGNKSKIGIISAIYKNKNGKFRVTDLVKEHCQTIFEEGMRLGIRNGIKIVMDDVHSKRIDPDDFSTMELNELSAYFYKEINEELEQLARNC